MLGMCPDNTKDHFGKEEGQRSVLLLDRLLPSIRASSSPLLQLPCEMLAGIIEWLLPDKPTLANLALVNTECRQLARSAQFAYVDVDYSPMAHDMVELLSYEALDRASGISKPYLGSCIRRMHMSSKRKWVAARHHELFEGIFVEEKRGTYPEGQMQ